MKNNEQLNKRYQEFFNEPIKEIEAEAPVSESIQILQPKKMCGPVTEEEFDKMFEDILKR
jgi:hypothetical protein